MASSSIVIASAARTPVGSFNGSFANTPAHELGASVISAVLERAGVAADDVDEAILGQVLTAGEGQNPAREAAMKAGIPQEATAFGINQLCGSGLRAVALGAQQIALGDTAIIVAGGQESMSMAPHAAHLRGGVKMGDFKMVDTMLKDGLIDAFHGYHMGITAENIARQWQLSREEQDEYREPDGNRSCHALFRRERSVRRARLLFADARRHSRRAPTAVRVQAGALKLSALATRENTVAATEAAATGPLPPQTDRHAQNAERRAAS